MCEISNEDLRWLYWGNENEEIIAKLTNEENDLKNFIESFKRNNELTDTILITRLLNLMKEANEANVEKSLAILKIKLSDKQIQRLYELNEKYKLVKLKEEIELEILEEYSRKLVIIKKIIQDNKYNYHIVKNTSIKKVFIEQCINEIKQYNLNITIDQIFDFVEEIYYEGE